MKIVRKRASSRNTLRAGQPDLFEWQPVAILNVTRAARVIASRYHVTLPHAVVIARCAGIGLEMEAR